MSDPQRRLGELLERFDDEHADLAVQLREVPPVTSLWRPPLGQVVLTTGTTTTPSDVAYLGTGTARDR